jgi:hypothetical protein
VFYGNMLQSVEILIEDRRQYRCFETVFTQLTVRLNTPTVPGIYPVNHFLSSANEQIEHALQGTRDRDMVGIAIRNDVNQSDRAVGIGFQREGPVIFRSDLERVRNGGPVEGQV